jgi:hypothetical protein
MKEGYAIRILSDGSGEIIKRPSMEVPAHRGKIWVDDKLIYLSFPAVLDVRTLGKPPREITDHVVSFAPSEQGLMALEAILMVRQDMLEKGNDDLLDIFCAKGTDIIMKLYKDILGRNDRSRAQNTD